jgi:hypothetical protein
MNHLFYSANVLCGVIIFCSLACSGTISTESSSQHENHNAGGFGGSSVEETLSSSSSITGGGHEETGGSGGASVSDAGTMDSSDECYGNQVTDTLCKSDCDCKSGICLPCVNTLERSCNSICSTMNCGVFTCDTDIGGKCSFKVCTL